MKAAVLYETNTPLRIEEISIDDPKENEVLIRLEAVGVCHSDSNFMKGVVPVPMPVVVGHEGCGIVEKIGPGVTSLNVGDKVITMVIFSCGQCRFCATGRPTLCLENMNVMIMAELPFFAGKRLRKGDQELYQIFGIGAFAEYCVVHERSAVKIPNDAPSDVVCLLGCGASTGIGSAINNAGVKPGEAIAVFGCGGVGLSAIMGAKLAGAGTIIAVDMLENKLDIAKELGADHVINAGETGNPATRIKELTDGLGADYSIEATGIVSVIEQAFASIHNGGKCVVAGISPLADILPVAPFELLLGKTLTGTSQGDVIASVDIPHYVKLFMDGKLPIDKLITHSFSLDEVNEAFDSMTNNKVLRSVIKF